LRIIISVSLAWLCALLRTASSNLALPVSGFVPVVAAGVARGVAGGAVTTATGVPKFGDGAGVKLSAARVGAGVAVR
jgi:hypothetical protein